MLMYGWPSVIRSGSTLLVWFGGLEAGVEDTFTLLGLSNFVGPPLSTLFFVVAIMADKKLRNRYGLRFLCCSGESWFFSKGSDEDRSSLRTDERSDGVRDGAGEQLQGGELLSGSLKAMVIDLCQQASLTIGIYVAAARGLSTSYQVAAMQSAMPEFGQAWTVGLALAIKLSGPQMIGGGEQRLFVQFVVGVLAFSLACSLTTGVAAVVPFGDFLAAEYGETACGYASRVSCLPLYRSIFEGPQALATTFATSFSAAVTLNCMYLMLKAVLYSCMDFDFMAVASVISLVVVFVPAILIAVRALDASAVSVFLAMYAPHVLLIPIFAQRIVRNCGRLHRGEPGPWAPFCRSPNQAQATSTAHSHAAARPSSDVPRAPSHRRARGHACEVL
jgi:hypothetical protein